MDFSGAFDVYSDRDSSGASAVGFNFDRIAAVSRAVRNKSFTVSFDYFSFCCFWCGSFISSSFVSAYWWHSYSGICHV